MNAPDETPVTAQSRASASLGFVSPRAASGPAGIWTLDGEALVASDADGPATVLVPTEAVRLIAVDLPIASRAKRLAALPYAIEDRIAEPPEAVHLAIGVELTPRRYLVGIVRHDRMAEWMARIEEAGLDHAALVPDALALPVPAAGEWAVDLGATRAVVRTGDGTGFAVPATMLRTAWEAAGRPPTIGYGAALPQDMATGTDALEIEPLGRRLLAPTLDLRQGGYARRRRSVPGIGRRLAQIAAIGALAHVGIAAADTIMLKVIAERRAADTRALVAGLSPGTQLIGDDIAGPVADLLPAPGGGGANAFLPAATRISSALAPLAAEIVVSAMRLEGDVVTVDIAPGDPAMPARVRAALVNAGVPTTVTTTADAIRITAPAA